MDNEMIDLRPSKRCSSYLDYLKHVDEGRRPQIFCGMCGAQMMRLDENGRLQQFCQGRFSQTAFEEANELADSESQYINSSG